jgi:hypothetical protein
MNLPVAHSVSQTASKPEGVPIRFEATIVRTHEIAQTGTPATSRATSRVTMSPAVPAPLRLLPSAEQRRFSELADRWIAETAMQSSVQRKVLHPAYQRIIGMGPQAIPMILTRLRDDGGYWFWALAAIADEDPAAEMRGYEDAREAWLEWGVEAGYLP